MVEDEFKDFDEEFDESKSQMKEFKALLEDEQIKLEFASFINKIVDERISKANTPLMYIAKVTAINNIDGTLTVVKNGSTTPLPNIPNYTKCDLSVGDWVYLLAIQGSLSNCIALTPCGKNPPKIGYKGAYIDSVDGFVCTSDDGAHTYINKTKGFEVTNSNNVKIAGVDNHGKFMSNGMVDLSVPNRRITIGQDPRDSDSYGIRIDNPNNPSTVFCSLSAGVNSEDQSKSVYLSSNFAPIYIVQFVDDGSGDMAQCAVSKDGVCLDGGSGNWSGGMSSNPNGTLLYYNNIQISMKDSVDCYGTFNVYNGAKNAVVTTKDYGNRAISAYELAEYYFGDIGENKLVDGECRIDIDPIFKQTVNTTIPYQVFLTKYGQGDIWVEERNKDYFVVKGTSDISFGWELKAKRLNYEDVRLTEYDSPKSKSASENKKN